MLSHGPEELASFPAKSSPSNSDDGLTDCDSVLQLYFSSLHATSPSGHESAVAASPSYLIPSTMSASHDTPSVRAHMIDDSVSTTSPIRSGLWASHDTPSVGAHMVDDSMNTHYTPCDTISQVTPLRDISVSPHVTKLFTMMPAMPLNLPTQLSHPVSMIPLTWLSILRFINQCHMRQPCVPHRSPNGWLLWMRRNKRFSTMGHGRWST